MGFLDSIISLFSSSDDPALVRKKRLKQLARDLSQNKYAKLFRTKSDELTPLFGKFLYDVYKVISPAQVFLQNAAKSQQLKEITIDAFLDKELIALKDRLSAAAIQQKAQSAPVKELSAAVKRDLSNYIAAFDNARISSIDNCYNAIIAMVNFVSFDFFYFQY